MTSPQPHPDLERLLDLVSVPRPNGSRALRRTARALRAHLALSGVPCRAEPVRSAAYFNELLGLWLILSGVGLLAAVVGPGGGVALAVALLVVLVPVLETGLLLPMVTGWIRVPAENLICELRATEPREEIVVSAHYDSKTELLDHLGRRWLLDPTRARVAMGLALLAGLASMTASTLQVNGAGWAILPLLISWVAAFPVAMFAAALGANLLLGRWRTPSSQGAVDNGAGVVVVMELCRRLAHGELTFRNISVTGCLFTGEEVQMQGARSFLRGRRADALPRAMVNLEAVGQDGGYGIWEADGTALTRRPLDPGLTESLEASVRSVTGVPPYHLPTINSDALPFLRAGIPAAVLSTLDRTHGLEGLHSPLDRRERVHAEKVSECVEVLVEWLGTIDREVGGREGTTGREISTDPRDQ